MAYPEMKSGSGSILDAYSLGRYTCLLIQDAESTGTNKYSFMLMVRERDSKDPVIVVTCEHDKQRELEKISLSTADGLDEKRRMELLEKSMQGDFCFFDRNGNHHVVESFERTPDAGVFCEKALAFAASKLGVTDAPKLHNSFKPKDRVEVAAKAEAAETKSEVPMAKVKLIPLLWGAFIIICALVLYIFLQHQEQEPKNYADCILKKISPATDRQTARVILHGCRKKFPEW